MTMLTLVYWLKGDELRDIRLIFLTLSLVFGRWGLGWYGNVLMGRIRRYLFSRLGLVGTRMV